MSLLCWYDELALMLLSCSAAVMLVQGQEIAKLGLLLALVSPNAVEYIRDSENRTLESVPTGAAFPLWRNSVHACVIGRDEDVSRLLQSVAEVKDSTHVRQSLALAQPLALFTSLLCAMLCRSLLAATLLRSIPRRTASLTLRCIRRSSHLARAMSWIGMAANPAASPMQPC